MTETLDTPFTAWVDATLPHIHRMSTDEAYRQEIDRAVQTALDDPRPPITHNEVLRRSTVRRKELLGRTHS